MLAEEHLPYLYAGYRAGSFKGCDDIPEELGPAEFDEVMGNLLGNALNNNATLMVLKADTKLKKDNDVKRLPVGLVVLSLFQNIAFPHVFWMPWATSRNKMEASVRFLNDLKKEHSMMVVVPKETLAWFSHLGKYGLLRKVGVLRNFIAPGEDATLFEGVR